MYHAESPTYHTEHQPRNDIYDYAKATEASDQSFADLARAVHAQSYLHEGFITEQAITDGHIVSDIDKATGPRVEYYIGFSQNKTPEPQPVSTLRKITMAEDGLQSLPGYQLCGSVVSDEGVATLHEAIDNKRPIKEISSFGHTVDVNALAGFELLRHTLQESLQNNEVWFFTMVSKKYKTLENSFGPRALRRVGPAVPMNDDRVGDVSLVPAIVDTATFFDDIAETILAEQNPHRRQRYLASLQLFTEGLDKQKLSNAVRVLVDDTFDVVAYAEERTDTNAATAWVQPTFFDPARKGDALAVKQLSDEGKVKRVVRPDWKEESGDDQLGEVLVYYPWHQALVQFPASEQAYFDSIHKRDNHLVTKAEQANRIGKSALYAGLSVGSHIAEHMAYAGVVDGHILADFDRVSLSNLNRLHAGALAFNEPKIDIVAKQISELNPYNRMTLLREGVTAESLESMPVPSIIFDAVDDFAVKALLRVYAQQHQLPLIMASDVGYRSVIDVERHDIGPTKPFNGRVSEAQLQAMLQGELSPKEKMRIMTRLIGLSNASFRLLESVVDPVLSGLPQLEVTASQGGALATIVARDILLGRRVPSGRKVHDARRAMGLQRETSLTDGLKVLQQFMAKQ